MGRPRCAGFRRRTTPWDASPAAGRLLNPYLIGQPLLRREAILSSRIEGTYITPEQLVLLEAGAPKAGGDARSAEDTREVLNYVRAMEHGLQLLKTLPISLRFVREVHGVLIDGVRGGQDRPGAFRTEQNYIAASNAPIGAARFVPPPVAEMLVALNRWEADLHQRPDPLPLLVRLALAHYQFEAIHPFRDGNGRMGRLLIPLLLCEHQRLPDPMLYMSAYFERHRQAYMDHLLAVSTRNAWEPWVAFFLVGVAECAREGLALADQLLALREAYHQKVRTARSSGLLAKLIDRLFYVPSITIAQTSALLDVTPAAASYNLKKLVELGIVTESPVVSAGRSSWLVKFSDSSAKSWPHQRRTHRLDDRDARSRPDGRACSCTSLCNDVGDHALLDR